jgi:hypothetical protein
MIDDAFGHWLAGFIDGEGCFTIPAHRSGGRPLQYSARLVVALRADDAAILREIRDRTGLGTLQVHRSSGQRIDGSPHHPGLMWMVAAKRDCMGIVDLLDRYPLRAKKAADYAIWREAVLLWSKVRRNGGHGHRAYDWTAVGDLAELLRAGRAYNGPSAAVPEPEPQPQLRLVS